MKGAYLGCQYSDNEIESYLKSVNAPYTRFENDLLVEKLAGILDEGNVIGRMQFGPRALGRVQSLEIPEMRKFNL